MCDVSELNDSSFPSSNDGLGTGKDPNSLCSRNSQETSRRMPKDAQVFVDLTMGDEIVVMHSSGRHVPQQIGSSEVLVTRPPHRVALQLEEWYAHMGRLMPPPCAVGPKTAQDINTWKSGQPVLWSYKGLEEMRVTYYTLDGSEQDRNRYVLVAQGPTKGPYILKCIQNSGRNSPPVGYHIWEGLNSAGICRGRGFERKPSISKCVRPPDRECDTTQTTVSCPVCMYQSFEFLPKQLVTILKYSYQNSIPLMGRSLVIC